jgi:hypothetical protein
MRSQKLTSVKNDAKDGVEVSGSRVITKRVAMEPDAGVRSIDMKDKTSIEESVGRVVKA